MALDGQGAPPITFPSSFQASGLATGFLELCSAPHSPTASCTCGLLVVSRSQSRKHVLSFQFVSITSKWGKPCKQFAENLGNRQKKFPRNAITRSKTTSLRAFCSFHVPSEFLWVCKFNFVPCLSLSISNISVILQDFHTCYLKTLYGKPKSTLV